jgi:hypothetical protein
MQTASVHCARMRKHKAKAEASVQRSKTESPVFEQAHLDRMKRCAKAIQRAEDCVEAAKKLIEQSKDLLGRAS